MAYASKQGRTRINSRSPSASGQCDRCGFLYNFSHLRWQMDYSGAGIYNKRILVCEKCYDTPQQQLKVIVIPPDPLPVLNARPPDYVNSETDYRYTSGQNTIDPVTGIPIILGDIRETNPTGLPYDYWSGELLLEGGAGFLVQEVPTWNTYMGLENTQYQLDTETGLPLSTEIVPYPGGKQDADFQYAGRFLLEEAEHVLPSNEYLRVTQQTGEPPGGLNKLPGTSFQVPGNDDPGLPEENVVIPYTGPLQWP